MSPVMSNDPRWNEEWHEKLLTISLLREGSLRREELKKRIRSEQSESRLTIEQRREGIKPRGMSDPYCHSVDDLKQMCREKGLLATGNKSDLIMRLFEPKKISDKQSELHLSIEQLREQIKSQGMPDPYCHTVDELKQMCREEGLPAMGNKDDLVIRLFEPKIGGSVQKEFPLLGQPYSDRNYDCWICNLIKRGLVEEDDRKLRLTRLGEWTAKSKLGSLFKRDSFLSSFVCKKCSSRANVVLLTPLLNTIDVRPRNIKGEIWVDLRCPTCEAIVTYVGLRFSKDELVEFYNQAITELRRFVKLKAQRI